MAEKKNITLVNHRHSAFHVPASLYVGKVPEAMLTSDKSTVIWGHDTSIVLSEEDAQAYLDYPGIVDAAKYVKPGAASDKLKKENEELKARVATLEKDLAEAKKK